LRIVVSGMVAGVPHHGGAAWSILQYLLGFRRLGHEVVLVEPVEAAAVVPAEDGQAPSESASYFDALVDRFGLEQRSALLAKGTRDTFGLPYEELVELCAGADVLINVSGMLDDPALTAHVPVRVYLDLDPAFAQVWHEQGIDMGFDRHTHFVTVGQAVGDSASPIPTCGRDWIPTVPPVVLERWPVSERIEHDALTTIGNWRGYGSVEHAGAHYGQKVHSMRRFMRLPTRTDVPFLLALSIHPDEKRDLDALRENRWRLVKATEVADTPDDYQRFVAGSWAEFGVAKSGYVESRSGWFSDRSAVYLASGRPVVAQETGFSRFLPTGEGLLAFETEDDVLAAIATLRSDYELHSRAARQLAERHLDSDRVLSRLLERLGVA
jgi:hypothetical protein